MGEILIGLTVLFMGVLLLFAGYRFARVLLPIWGFVSGFSLGAAITADMTSNGFLEGLLGVTVGLLVGLLFAVLIYAYFYAAIILFGAMIGYWVGSGFISILGIDPGVLTAVSGIIIGSLFAIAAVALNAPKALLIIGSSIIGAMSVIGGLLLIFNQIPLDFFSYLSVKAVVADSVFWTLGAIALAIVGAMSQFFTTHDYELEEWYTGSGSDHHTTPRAPTPTHP